MIERQEITLIPLGAGDLVDRAVRFYRKHFLIFVLIASPPVVIGTIISVGWTLAAGQIFTVGADKYTADGIFYNVFLWFGSIVIWGVETIATLIVMGGASRNFVRHLLFGEAITFLETYRNAGKRLGGLLVAATVMTIILSAIGGGIFYFAAILGFLLIALIGATLSFIPIVAFLLSLVAGLAIAFGAVWVFFMAASRLAYVPQVMLVEGQGVFQAIGRSASLASGNVRRLATLFIFTTVATYSALALLYVPLAWFAEANGISLIPFSGNIKPAWFEVASGLIWQISLILMSPVLMIGLCLLYVDERVRGEGYDIELMAAARLGDIPTVPENYLNPLHPALSNAVAASPNGAETSRSSVTTLGPH
ncbi:hypothetical protein BH10ACI2_BH10ACI2_21130 [soil metagenome]